ncbi:MAG: hypothetical protein WCL06_04690 [Bacteroidota bacterium]
MLTRKLFLSLTLTAVNLLLISKPIYSQFSIPFFGNHELISGYESSIEGEVLPYFSSCPDFAKEALLTRCTDGKKTISWQTGAIPQKAQDGYYYFYWLSGHSSGTSGANRNFDLMINGTKVLSFKTPAKKISPFVWTFAGKDSVSVVFEATATDIHKDVFGNMYLRVPEKMIVVGKPLNLSITGHAENSNDWFMVFRYSFSEKFRINASPLLINTETGVKQLLQVYIDHITPDQKNLQIVVNSLVRDIQLTYGYNYLEIPVDTVSKPTILNITLKSAKQIIRQEKLVQYPVHRREVDIIHHSHNDVGYSHVQEDVIKIQQQNIMDALEMIDKTASYPKESRFKWNEETLWPVEYFFKHASESDKKRFIKAVMNKNITLSGFYVGVMTGLCSAKELGWITEYAAKLKKTYSFPIQTAMFSDIPGLSWSITDVMVKDGLKYLSNGPNFMENFPDRGDRIGSTLRAQGDKPFYWRTTDGKGKILVWTAGRGYSAFHQIPADNMAAKIKEKLVAYLNELDTIAYPYDMIQLRYTIKSDNGPVDKNLSDFVRDWNTQYVSPKLVIAGVNDMMQRFEKKYGDKLPEYSGDFTPYWEDGAYSTAAEEGETRILSDYIIQLERIQGSTQDRIADPEWYYEARKNIVMFHEHTWGAWNSISSPDDAFAINQWNYKKAFIDTAKLYVDKIESVLFPRSKSPNKLIIYNTFPYVRSGYVETQLPENLKGNILIDENGNASSFQKLNNGNICFIADHIPANSHKTYSVAFRDTVTDYKENKLPFEIDSTTGAIKSYSFHGKEFVSNLKYQGLNQALYINGLDPTNASTSRVQKISVSENGCVNLTIKVECNMEGSKKLTYFYEVFPGLDYIRITTEVDKKAVRSKEAMHIAYPFDISNPVNRVGISDTFFIPGIGQIPGANKDFYSVQRWIDVSGPDYGVTLSSPQIALFEIGVMTDERPLNHGFRSWKEEASPSATFFLYALNNYWNTNFKADQSGTIRFDCYLQFHNNFDAGKAEKFGEEMHNPFVSYWK